MRKKKGHDAFHGRSHGIIERSGTQVDAFRRLALPLALVVEVLRAFWIFVGVGACFGDVSMGSMASGRESIGPCLNMAGVVL